MAHRKDFLLLDDKKFFLPEDDHPLLGRICSDANEPNRNYFPSNPVEFYSKDAKPFHIVPTSPEATIHSAESDSARFALDRIFKFLREKERERVSTWQTEKVRIFTLPQENETLSNMVNDSTMLTKMNDWLSKEDSLYMITGYMTMINAQFSNDTSRTENTEFEASLTRVIEAAMQASGAAPIRLPELIAAMKRSSGLSTSWKATYAEETVFAVKYRQIVKKWKLKSWLVNRDIRLRNAVRIPGASMFGQDGDDLETRHWQEVIDTELEEDEEEEICFSPADQLAFFDSSSSGNVYAVI